MTFIWESKSHRQQWGWHTEMRQEKMWNEVLWCITLLAAVLQCVERQDMVSTWHRTFSGGLQGRTTCSISPWRRRERMYLLSSLLSSISHWTESIQNRTTISVYSLVAIKSQILCSTVWCYIQVQRGKMIWLWQGGDHKNRRQWKDSEEAHKFVSNTDHPLCHSHVLMPSS